MTTRRSGPGASKARGVVGSLGRDLALAARRLGRRPGFSGVVVATLALGIGGATAIFSVAHAVVLRPFPFHDPDRLVLLWQSDEHRGQPFVEMSYPTYRDWRDGNHVFTDLAGMPSTNQGWVLTLGDRPRGVSGRIVTANFFSVLGVAPARGRAFVPEDDRVGAARVVVLSDALWRGVFGSAPDVVDRSIVLDGESFGVVGVMPRGFAYPRGAELWTPVVPAVGAEVAEDAGVWWMSGLGRLAPGVSLGDARREMGALALAYNREHFQAEGITAAVTPLAQAVLGPTRPALLALLGAVGLVLLVACANVAGLQLVQLAERSQEMAVRLALGASPGRLARALFAESLVLCAAAGILGVLTARAAVPVLVALAPGEVPRLNEASVDSATLVFAGLVSLVSTGLCALAPMLAVRARGLVGALHDVSRSAVSGHGRLRVALVVGEVALALVLLVGGGLLVRSFLALSDVPLGFEPGGVLSVEVGPPPSHAGDVAQRRQFFEEMLRRVRALPGVESAAVVTRRPLSGTVGMDWPFTVEGQSAKDAERNPLVNFETVSPGYFETMGIPLVRGRDFLESDRDGRPGVVVVSEALARRYWPDQDPIGQRIKIPLPPTEFHDQWMTVVGVAADVRYRELRATRLDLYMSYRQSDHPSQHLVVRSGGDVALVAPLVRRTVQEQAPELPAPAVTMMDHVVSEALGDSRFAARLFSAFALVALLLAALGLYGLLAWSVSRRTREIGVRVALGARPIDVGRLVVGEGLALVAAGLTLGVLAALLSAHALSALLYAVEPTDGLTLVAASALLVGVGALSCWVPTRRALRLDPVVALRHE
jgi:putative ABC transport system permease protein